MKRSTGGLLVLAGLLLALVAASGAASSGNETMEHTDSSRLEKLASGDWSLEATVQALGQSATGRVTLRLQDEPDPGSPPHLGLALARAWLSLGGSFLASGDYSHAVQAAESGLDALGSGYVSPMGTDDTDLKVKAAEMQAEQGKLENAAKVLLDMLEVRTRMYADLYSSEVLE